MLKSLINFFYSNKTKAINSGVKLGENCIIAESVDFGSEPYLITIGNHFYSSDNVKFITHDGSVNVLRNLYEKLKNADLIGKIIVGNNVFLGVDVVVLPGTEIGDNVIVGAKSIVKGILNENSVYAGIPAKYVCSIEEFKNKNLSKIIYTKHLSYNDKRLYLTREKK